MNRRVFLTLLGIGLVTGCAVPAASPTSAPPKPTSAPAKPTQPAAAPPTSKPTASIEKPAASQPTAAPTAVSKPERASLVHAHSTAGLGGMLGSIAKELGYFEEQNLDVDVQLVASGATIQQGLIGGEFDIIENDGQGGIVAISTGADQKIVFCLEPGHNMVVITKKEINSLAELVGRPIATGQPASYPYNTFQALFDNEGLDMQKSQLLPLSGTPARVQALSQGQVDATVVVIDFLPSALQDPNIKLLMTANEKLPRYLALPTFATGKLIREKPDVVTRHAIAMTKAARTLVDDPARVASVWGPIVKLEPDQARQVAEEYVKARVLDPNGRVTPEQVDFMQDFNIKLGDQKSKLSFDQIVEPSVVDRVLAAIGPYKGSYASPFAKS